MQKCFWRTILIVFLATCPYLLADTIELRLQRRDPEMGAVTHSLETVDPHRVGIVIVDMWNWHWCKTSSMRVAALVPRMIRVIESAQAMGMTIFWCPSDVADNYVGTWQHEATGRVEKIPLPELADLNCPPAPDGGGCTCGRERCQGNYGWDAMHPDLVMGENDFLPNDLDTLYSLCRQRGLTHLIYMGVHTQVCLLGKAIGLRNLARAGLKCLLARDLTDAHGRYDPDTNYTPDQMTFDVVAHFERHLAPTINFVDELRRLRQWNDSWIVDPVRVAPWGTPMRPHFFEKEVTVTLSAPWQPQATIRFTLDGSEPKASSPAYTAPLRLSDTTHVRAAAFEGNRRVCIASEGYFVRLPPMPPAPDVHLSDVTALRAVGPGHSPSSDNHRFSPVSNPPQKDRNNRQGPLRLRGKTYAKGLGVHAPNQLVYELKPEYDRFVALAGADENVLQVSHGSNLAMYPSVVFKVFVDGKLMATSAVMRISEPPWRFDIKLPDGARKISLCVTDAGNGNKEDLADWVNAGFVQANR